MDDLAHRIARASISYWKAWDRFVEEPWSQNGKWDRRSKDLNKAESSLRKLMARYENGE